MSNQQRFSCSRSTIGFNQPSGERLTPTQLWERRNQLTTILIGFINAAPTVKGTEIGGEIMRYREMCKIIRKLREIDPSWHLVVAPRLEDALRIMHYDCLCNPVHECKCAVLKKENFS
jgi:hypothetical protein